MQYKLNLFSKGLFYNFKNKFFLIGVFFIPSSLLISLIFLFPCFIFGSFNRKNYFLDNFNCLLFLSGLLITISAFLQNFVFKNSYEDIYNSNLSLIGIANWLPLFWIFWAAQPFLNSKIKRKNFALALIFGTFPVLITGFGQYFLKWYGPFEILNGLIIWYQKPIIAPAGLSGLFSNQNYAGTWLNLVWPFCIALIMEKKDDFKNQIVSFIYLFSVGFAAFLTYSRNAWAGLITSFLILFGKKSLVWSLPIILTLLIIIFLAVSTNIPPEIQNYVSNLIPDNILMELSAKGYEDLDITRTEILLSGLRLITLKPLFGFGAASFTKIFESQTSFWKGHSHNLLIELAISYGLPVTIIIFSIITSLLIKSWRLIFYKKNNLLTDNIFDKAHWVSIFFFCGSQIVDIQYFDGKISIVGWLLLAGLKMILSEEKRKKLKTFD